MVYSVTIHGLSEYDYGCAMLAWKQTKAYSDKSCEAGTAPSASGKSIADATYVLARMACGLMAGGAVNRNY